MRANPNTQDTWSLRVRRTAKQMLMFGLAGEMAIPALNLIYATRTRMWDLALFDAITEMFLFALLWLMLGAMLTIYYEHTYPKSKGEGWPYRNYYTKGDSK